MTIEYSVGTMIELPRAAMLADQIAEIADFFSFGTNDLTQTVFGLSRDDAGTFLPHYVELGILPKDPFVSIDIEGVGEMMRIASEKGRATKNDLKLGICGEHGGDPASIAFCETIGLDYVSCSPYRVPVARLAAAQAALGATGIGRRKSGGEGADRPAVRYGRSARPSGFAFRRRRRAARPAIPGSMTASVIGSGTVVLLARL